MDEQAKQPELLSREHVEKLSCDEFVAIDIGKSWRDSDAAQRARIVALEQELQSFKAQVFKQYDKEEDLIEQRARLREALCGATASLVAAIALLERAGKAVKKAAPSDKMFDQMVRDYKAAVTQAKAALHSGKEKQ